MPSLEILKQTAEGIQNRLVGFELLDRGVPRHSEIADEAGNIIGRGHLDTVS